MRTPKNITFWIMLEDAAVTFRKNKPCPFCKEAEAISGSFYTRCRHCWFSNSPDPLCAEYGKKLLRQFNKGEP